MQKSTPLYLVVLLLACWSQAFTDSMQPQALLVQHPPYPFQTVLGPEDAAVTVLVYTSLSCEVCAEFHKSVEGLVSRYAPRVRVILRDYPTDGPSFDASLLCWRKPEHAAMLRDFLYHNQEWADAENPTQRLKEMILTQLAGTQKEALEDCLRADGALAKKLMEFKLREKKLAGLTRVPLAFVISGNAIERIDPAALEPVEKTINQYLGN